MITVLSKPHKSLRILFCSTPSGCLHSMISRAKLERCVASASYKIMRTGNKFWNKQLLRASQGSFQGWQASTYVTTAGIVLFGTGRSHRTLDKFSELDWHNQAYPNARGAMLELGAMLGQEIGVFLETIINRKNMMRFFCYNRHTSYGLTGYYIGLSIFNLVLFLPLEIFRLTLVVFNGLGVCAGALGCVIGGVIGDCFVRLLSFKKLAN